MPLLACHCLCVLPYLPCPAYPPTCLPACSCVRRRVPRSPTTAPRRLPAQVAQPAGRPAARLCGRVFAAPGRLRRGLSPVLRGEAARQRLSVPVHSELPNNTHSTWACCGKEVESCGLLAAHDMCSLRRLPSTQIGRCTLLTARTQRRVTSSTRWDCCKKVAVQLGFGALRKAGASIDGGRRGSVS